MQTISKEFNKVAVLSNVDFTLSHRSVHALTGENGAGKSTLMKILTGLHSPTAGNIYVNNIAQTFNHPKDAEAQGLVFIHQELNLLPFLSISANCFLGKELYNKFGVLNEKEMARQTSDKLKEIGLSFSPQTLVGTLPIGHQQVVEIVKALLVPNIKVIIMDEPTSALSRYETEYLFEIIRSLKEKDVSIVYISHRMDELFLLCDHITILRDGEKVHTGEIQDIDLTQTVSLMVGRVLDQQFPSKKTKKESPPTPQNTQQAQRDHLQNTPVLSVDKLTKKGVFSDISFELHRGEILGFAGLVGAGRTDLLHALFGSGSYDSGSIVLDGKPIANKNPSQAMRNQFAFVTEDRKQEGFVDVFDIQKNISLCNFSKIMQHAILSPKKEQHLAHSLCGLLGVRYQNTSQLVATLSGGNQQKTVLAKWLASLPKILLLDEPTRGIDVASKYDIYTLMRSLSTQGVSIIMVSSELPEILGMSDRILIMREGKIHGECVNKDITQEYIMTIATQTPSTQTPATQTTEAQSL